MNSVEVATKEIDYRQWIGSTADELGYGGNQHPSVTYRHEAENGQQTNVFVVDGRQSDSDPTYIGVNPYNYRLDKLLQVQSRVFAHQTSSRMIMAEMPGVTIDTQNPWNTKGDRITPLQLVTNVAGNFSHTALSQLEAIDAAVTFRLGGPVRFLAQSLGTVAIVAMAQVISQNQFHTPLSIEAINIVESVNTYGSGQFLRPLKVLKNLEEIEAPRHEFYFDENRIIGHSGVTAFERMPPVEENRALWEYLTKKQHLAVTTPAIGLHRSLMGPLVASVLAKKSFRDVPISFYRGNDSSVSLESDNIAAAEALRELGANARVINLVRGKDDDTQIGHHFATSLGRYASFAKLLRSRS